MAKEEDIRWNIINRRQAKNLRDKYDLGTIANIAAAFDLAEQYRELMGYSKERAMKDALKVIGLNTNFSHYQGSIAYRMLRGDLRGVLGKTPSQKTPQLEQKIERDNTDYSFCMPVDNHKPVDYLREYEQELADMER